MFLYRIMMQSGGWVNIPCVKVTIRLFNIFVSPSSYMDLAWFLSKIAGIIQTVTRFNSYQYQIQEGTSNVKFVLIVLEWGMHVMTFTCLPAGYLRCIVHDYTCLAWTVFWSTIMDGRKLNILKSLPGMLQPWLSISGEVSLTFLCFTTVQTKAVQNKNMTPAMNWIASTAIMFETRARAVWTGIVCDGRSAILDWSGDVFFMMGNQDLQMWLYESYPGVQHM